MNTHTPPVTIMLPAFNADQYIAASIKSLLNQTFADFEMIISDNASQDNTEAICREFAAKDSRIRYIRNPVNIGANGNFINMLSLSRGEYLLLASDHDLWRPDILEHCLREYNETPEAVLVYSPATIIAATGEVLRVNNPDTPRDIGRFSTFFNVFSGAICSEAIYGLMRKNALLKTSIHTSLGPDTILLAELSLYGKFRQLSQSYYFRRLNRPPESPQESAKRYISMLFENPPEVVKVMPYTYMVYKSLCMVQNNNLSFQDQQLLNTYILLVFTRSWGITTDKLVELLIYMKNHPSKENQFDQVTFSNFLKPERRVLDIDMFFKTIENSQFSEIEEKYSAQTGASVKGNKKVNLSFKKWDSNKEYDVCYVLYNTDKWGGVKSVLSHINGLVDRGYRVCLVSKSGPPTWYALKSDFIHSETLSPQDIPESDIIVGTWYPTLLPAYQ